MQLIQRATSRLQKTAVQCRGREFTYRDILLHSSGIKEKILQGRKDFEGERIAYLAPQSYEFIPVQWGIWQAGGVSVPLCLQHPPPEWEYIIDDSKASVVICHSNFLSQLAPLAERKGIRIIPFGDFFKSDGKVCEIPDIHENRPAQIIYTSGTTGRPKGAVSSHRCILAQMKSVSDAWDITEKDHILEVLPLHHVHGNIVVLSTSLYSGAKVSFLSKFHPQAVWKEFINLKDLNLFMGVPTVYSKLIQNWKEMRSDERLIASKACEKFRLMVCGSMSLPETVINEWKSITGQVLLERYGMTECGMILSNPLNGERKPGYVGTPLPGVQVKLVESEIRVKSDGMFSGYLNKDKETKAAFDEEGWFRTGDIGIVDGQGNYKILGRESVDIIKSGGYKISAIDVENHLLNHPDIQEVFVLGIPDHHYGQSIAVIFKSSKDITLHELQNWSKERMAEYQIPRKIVRLEEIPKNPMGKVNKKELAKLFS